MRATSASLRRPPPLSVQDPGQPTPSERIANNYSPWARGLSPRTLEAFFPGGIKPGALGPLPVAEWDQVDDSVMEQGVPEADGVITAARRRIAFMPLELFDNTEYEMHSPEEWVQLAQQQGGYSAETLMYQSGSGAYVWVPCRVTSWDPVARAFEVQFQAHGPAAGVQTAPNGHTGLANGSGKGGAQQDAPGGRDLAGGLTKKLVKRLNLRFKAENPAVFDARVGSAKAARKVAESELRLLFYLDALEPGVEEVLTTYDFHTALTPLPLLPQVPGLRPEVLDPVGRVLLEDAADYYERAVKAAILNYRSLQQSMQPAP
ncbi:uncharacterized protein HaLaN_21723, partial [Haematococcus lacustris]